MEHHINLLELPDDGQPLSLLGGTTPVGASWQLQPAYKSDNSYARLSGTPLKSCRLPVSAATGATGPV